MIPDQQTSQQGTKSVPELLLLSQVDISRMELLYDSIAGLEHGGVTKLKRETARARSRMRFYQSL